MKLSICFHFSRISTVCFLGDTDFFDAKFSLRASKEPASSPHGVVLDPQQQLELDLQLAMSLQEENEREELPVDDPVMSKRNVESKAAAGVSDFELAKQLQAEEEAMARANTSKVNSPAKPVGGMIYFFSHFKGYGRSNFGINFDESHPRVMLV